MTEFGDRDPKFLNLLTDYVVAQESGEERSLQSVVKEIQEFGAEKFDTLFQEYQSKLQPIVNDENYQQARAIYEEYTQYIDQNTEGIQYISDIIEEYSQRVLDLPEEPNQLLRSLMKLGKVAATPLALFEMSKFHYKAIRNAAQESEDVGDFKKNYGKALRNFRSEFDLPTGGDLLRSLQILVPLWNGIIRFGTEMLKPVTGNFRAAAYDFAFLTYGMSPEEKAQIRDENEVKYEWNPYEVFTRALTEATSSALAGFSNEMHLERVGGSLSELFPYATKKLSMPVKPLLDKYDVAIAGLERRNQEAGLVGRSATRSAI